VAGVPTGRPGRFVVFGIKGQVSEDVVYDSATGNPVSMHVLGPMYTHMDAIEHFAAAIARFRAGARQPRKESQ
jgi:hypothetical protein